MIKIYTDGSCIGNPGPGGWAAIILNGDKQDIISGRKKNTTNNQMELMAAIKALVFLKKKTKNQNLYRFKLCQRRNYQLDKNLGKK